MSRTSLADALSDPTRAGGPDLLVSSAGSWSASGLRRARAALPEIGDGGDVVLRLADPLKLALALFALDGVAPRLVLLSSGIAAADAEDLLARCNPGAVITDDPEPFPFEPPGTLVRWLEPVGPAPAVSGNPPENPSRDTRWVFATSGTTGRPKLVEHSLSSLSRTTKRPVEGGGAPRFGLLYEMARFAGIQVFLQGVLGGGGLVLPDTGSPLGHQLVFLARNGCTALSATPTHWRKILMTPECRELRLHQVTLGGEVADDAVLSRLRTAFPDARIVHIYASTEAGAAFSVKDGRAGFPASYLETPPAGITLAVREDRLFVQNAEVNPVYLGSDQSFADADGFVDTGDVVERQDDRYLFRGRANGVINIGGNKLFPEEVERLLLQHEAVRFARVSARASPITGQLVVAEVVAEAADADRQALTGALLAHCRAHLHRWQVPAILRVVESIGTTSAGKLERVKA
jgi:acyl-CoA synthetase (AMP-forming)/AMP-acid ligase II